MVAVHIIIKMEYNLQEVLLQAKNMAMVYSYFQMEQEFKDFGKKTICKDQQKFFTKTVIIIKEIYICHKKQERVHIVGIMNNNNKQNIKDSLKKIILMDMQ